MITEKELAGFLAMHAGFRTELGRLAEAAVAPRDTAHEEVLEEHIALVLDILHAHHVHEDEHVLPYLIACSPGSTAVLHALETEHEVLDPLLEAAADTRRPLPERAPVLRRMHELVNEHLDHEESVAVPLMLAHYTPQMVERDRAKVTGEIGRRRMATVFGWIASCLDDDPLATSLEEHPRLVRFLFRRYWWPAYQERMTALYGVSAQPVSRQLAAGVGS